MNTKSVIAFDLSHDNLLVGAKQHQATTRRFWILWLGAILIVAFVHLMTMTTSPIVWQDEVQIVEFGRVLLYSGKSYWSIVWSLENNRPLHIWTYLGTGLSEIGYRLFAPTIAGARLTAMLGGLLAATCFVGWMRARDVNPLTALVCGLVFLLDPVIVQSYRGARVDCWVFACCFAACWAVRAAGKINNARYYLLLMSGGALATTAFFVWASSILLYPLIGYAFLETLWQSERRKNISEYVLAVGACLVGAGIAFGLLILPLVNQADFIFADMRVILSANQSAPSLNIDIAGARESFKYSPLILIAAAVSCFSKRNALLGILTISLFMYVLATRMYIYRAIYLLPYMMTLICSFGGSSLITKSKSNVKLYQSGIGFLLLWACALSLVARPAVALRDAEARDHDKLVEAGREYIGSGNHKVYLESWQFYYVARTLGWRAYKSYSRAPGTENKQLELLGEMDFAIVSDSDLTASGNELLMRAGFKKSTHINLNQGNESAQSVGGYGDFVIFSR